MKRALYRRLSKAVREALGALEHRGEAADLAGVVWMQGEHEAGISPTMAEHDDRLLTTLMQAIRRDGHAVIVTTTDLSRGGAGGEFARAFPGFSRQRAPATAADSDLPPGAMP